MNILHAVGKQLKRHFVRIYAQYHKSVNDA